MAANKFVLKGGGVEVEFTVGITPVSRLWCTRMAHFRKALRPIRF